MRLCAFVRGGPWTSSRQQCTNVAIRRRLWKGVALLVLMTMMIRPLAVSGKLEGRRCRNSSSDLTLVDQLHQSVCKACHPSQSELNVVVDKIISDEAVGESELNNIPNQTSSNIGFQLKKTFESGEANKSYQCNINSAEKERYHVVVLLMGMARMEKALVLMAELIDRDHLVTVVTTQQMAITNHLHDILRQHIPCNKNVMDFLHVEAFHMNEAWPCQPPPAPSFHATVNTDNTAHHSFYHNGRSAADESTVQNRGRRNPLDASLPLHCNAHHVSFLMRKLLRIVTRMNRRPDVIVADSNLLPGLLVAEASKLPCLAIVPDDMSPADPSSTLKWTHPKIYRRLQTLQKLETFNFAVAVRLRLEQWWREWQDQLGMTSAFITYNNVRRKLHLPPRYQILDFWKTVVLWTSLTQHLPDPPIGNPRMLESGEHDVTMVDFKAYLYSKTGIGIGTSASKGNSLPLISLPEPSVPPCQPCEPIDNLEEDALIFGDEPTSATCQVAKGEPEVMQLLVPYYNYGKSLADRQRFRQLMRALVLLRDSLLAWPKCLVTSASSADAAFIPYDCWTGDLDFSDFQVIRLGNSYESFVPSILEHDLSPFLDAVANHKSIVAIILPDCKSSASSQWMQDLGFPSVCLPEGEAWNVRVIALRIGRFLRHLAKARKTGEDISAMTLYVGGGDIEKREYRKPNGHTLYGTTIRGIADVVEVMARTKRDSQGDWSTGDDMAWDVWLRLGLVRRPSSLTNTDSWEGWFRGGLLTMSWVVMVSAAFYIILKDHTGWIAKHDPISSFARRRRSNHNEKQDDSESSSSMSGSQFQSFSAYFCWPTFVLMRIDSIKDAWSVVVDEFTERMPDLDRLYDMWKEWAAEESEQMNVLLFAWFDKPVDLVQSTTPRLRNSDQQNHNNNNGNNHTPQQRKRRVTRKKH